MAEQDFLGQFYKALASKSGDRLGKIHIPLSDVFYIREKIKNDKGITYSLAHIEWALYVEGHLEEKDVSKRTIQLAESGVDTFPIEAES